MSLNKDETELLLKLTTFAAKEELRKVSVKILDRATRLHDQQADDIRQIVGLLHETNKQLVANTERQNALGDKVEGVILSLNDRATVIAKEVVETCAERHGEELARAKGHTISKIAMMVALASFLFTVAGKAWGWVAATLTSP